MVDPTEQDVSERKAEEASIERLRGVYEVSSARKRLLLIITAVLLAAAVVVSVSIGAVNIPLSDTLKVFGHAVAPSLIAGPDNAWYSDIILNARLSRTVLCILCGFSLAIAGAVMQNVLRNPLVSPFTLGVSSAASFGASMAIVFGGGITGSILLLGHEFFVKNLLIAFLAFIAGLGSISLVILLSKRRDISRSTIILTGVIISYFFQAGVTAAKYFSDDSALREITLWLMGGMWNATWGVDFLLIPIVVVCVMVIESKAVDVNVLSAGDEVATSLGINVARLRSSLLLISTLVTSVCIAFTGIIGFIGLIAPHLTRMLIGNDNRYLFPASGLMGAFILLVSDIVARMVIRPSELPVGVIMYIVGGIFFIWMVTRRKKEVAM